jgi:hypothetical protein
MFFTTLPQDIEIGTTAPNSINLRKTYILDLRLFTSDML